MSEPCALSCLLRRLKTERKKRAPVRLRSAPVDPSRSRLAVDHGTAGGRAGLRAGLLDEALALAGVLALAGRVGRLAGALALAGVRGAALHAGCERRRREARGGEDRNGSGDQHTLVHGDPPGWAGQRARMWSFATSGFYVTDGAWIYWCNVSLPAHEYVKDRARCPTRPISLH